MQNAKCKMSELRCNCNCNIVGVGVLDDPSVNIALKLSKIVGDDSYIVPKS